VFPWQGEAANFLVRAVIPQQDFAEMVHNNGAIIWSDHHADVGVGGEILRKTLPGFPRMGICFNDVKTKSCLVVATCRYPRLAVRTERERPPFPGNFPELLRARYVEAAEKAASRLTARVRHYHSLAIGREADLMDIEIEIPEFFHSSGLHVEN